MRSVIIIGDGGHAGVLADTLYSRGENFLGFTSLSGKGDRVLGADNVIDAYSQSDIDLVNGIGNVATKLNSGLGRREVIFSDFATRRGYAFPVVRHPSAIISRDVLLCDGVQIFAGAIIQNGVRIGENTIINAAATVTHDCKIGRHCHIAPGAILCGGVTIGNNVHIGAGAVVLQQRTINSGAIIAAGATVVGDVDEGKYWGRR